MEEKAKFESKGFTISALAVKIFYDMAMRFSKHKEK